MKTTLEPPLSRERAYSRELLLYVSELEKAVKQKTIPKITALVEQMRSTIKTDSVDGEAQSSFDDILAIYLLFLPTIKQKVAQEFEFVNKWNYREWSTLVKQQVKQKKIDPVKVIQNAPAGLPVYEQFLPTVRDVFLAENVALVKAMSERLAEEIAGIMRREIIGGATPEAIKEEILKRVEVTKARAKLIAEDQVFKLHSDLTMYRAQSIGSKGYVWRTMKDERVRKTHREREGKVFAWNKPPAGGQHPGQEIRCRCRAAPLFE